MNKDAIITAAHTFCRGKRNGFWIETDKGVFTFEVKEKVNLYGYFIVVKTDLTKLVGATLNDWHSFITDGPYNGSYNKSKIYNLVLETSRGDFKLSLECSSDIYDDEEVWYRIGVMWEERLYCNKRKKDLTLIESQ